MDGWTDAFPQTNDVLFGIKYGDTGVASLVVYAGNGSSSTDVAVIPELAVGGLHLAVGLSLLQARSSGTHYRPSFAVCPSVLAT